MIVAGLTLLAVGSADLIRPIAASRRRWALRAVAAALLLVGAAAVDAAGWALLAMGIAVAWQLAVSADGTGRAGLWPIGLLTVAAAAAAGLAGPRESSAAFDRLWSLAAPVGPPVPADLVVLLVGAAVFLLESGNVVVRTALHAEHAGGSVPTADAASAVGTDAATRPASATTGLKGGRIIGPLERVLVFGLMLAGAYVLIAAVLAAKGIVRFPEISRDSAEGERAEYFLIGSLVSWVLALAAALLVWWGSR